MGTPYKNSIEWFPVPSFVFGPDLSPSRYRAKCFLFPNAISVAVDISVSPSFHFVMTDNFSTAAFYPSAFVY